MKSRMILFSAVLVLVFSAVLLAGEKGEGPGMGKCMKGEMGMGMGMGCGPRMALAMASELNLTADQMDKIKKLIDTMPEKGAAKQGMKEEMAGIHEEMLKDSPDQAKINSIIDKAAAAHKTKIADAIKCKAELNSVLTKEQKEIMKKKMEEKKEKMQDKKDKRKK